MYLALLPFFSLQQLFRYARIKVNQCTSWVSGDLNSGLCSLSLTLHLLSVLDVLEHLVLQLKYTINPPSPPNLPSCFCTFNICLHNYENQKLALKIEVGILRSFVRASTAQISQYNQIIQYSILSLSFNFSCTQSWFMQHDWKFYDFWVERCAYFWLMLFPAPLGNFWIVSSSRAPRKHHTN